LGTEGATSTLSDAYRQQIAKEVQGLFDGVLQLANTQYQGVYLFGGTMVSQKPFSYDAVTDTIKYNGNSDISKVSVTDGRTIATNVPGDQLFQNASGSVLDSLHNLVNALKNGTQTDIKNAAGSVSTALSQFSTERIFYGNTVNQLTSVESYLNQDKINLASQENDLIGVDTAQAATDLAQAVTANNAALSAFAKMSSKTLLDYLG
jgi:flagellar hook-associated protein 3 FlgL